MGQKIITRMTVVVVFASLVVLIESINNKAYEPIEVKAETKQVSQCEYREIVIECETASISTIESKAEESLCDYRETEQETEIEEKPKELWYEQGTFYITHYCSCSKCCGKWGNVTRSGTTPTRHRTVAVDPKVIPLGTKIYIEGYGYRIAEDTGSAVKGNHIDVYTGSDHQFALSCGTPHKKVWVVKEVEDVKGN